MWYRKIIAVAVTLALALGIVGTALADTSPNGHGQPGAPGTTCNPLTPSTALTPGNASSASGSPFNQNGTAGAHYAGNPGTASLAHANSSAAVSQYDIACFQVSQPHP
jgi:hypothetical protein